VSKSPPNPKAVSALQEYRRRRSEEQAQQASKEKGTHQETTPKVEKETD